MFSLHFNTRPNYVSNVGLFAVFAPIKAPIQIIEKTHLPLPVYNIATSPSISSNRQQHPFMADPRYASGASCSFRSLPSITQPHHHISDGAACCA